MTSRAERELEPEIMDGPLSYGEARSALRDLDRVNRLTLGLGGLLRCLLPRLTDGRERSSRLDLLDVGSGTGLGARRLARAAGRRGVRVRAVGVDRRLAHLVIGRELEAARKAPESTRKAPGGSLLRVVASADALPFRDGAFDWSCSHLLFHHFGGRTNRKIVAEMLRCARRGVAVVDLRRTPLAARLARVLFPLLGVGHVATEDGVLSVRQSWTPEEIHHLAHEAGWPLAELRLRFPFRWSLVLTHGEER